MRKLILIALLTGFGIAQAEEPAPKEATAACYLEVGNQFNRTRFVLFEPFTQTAHVAIRGVDGVEREVPSRFDMDTWITYQAEFEFEGKPVKLIFSNFNSPSMGKMEFADGKIEKIVCELFRN